MVNRQWIVCGVLGLGLLGARPLFAQNKPADLPIDPRVRCEDGPESDPYRLQSDLPVSPRCADNCGDTFVQRLQKSWEPWFEGPLPNLPISITLGLGADASAGPIVLVTMTDVNGEVLDTTLPLPCSPLTRWAASASALIWQSMTAMIFSAPTPPTPQQQEPPPACPNVRPVEAQEEEEELDPIFLDILRKTKPLGLVPTPQIDPAKVPTEIWGGGYSPPPYTVETTDIFYLDSLGNSSASIRGEYVVRADGTISLGSYGSVYVQGMTVGQVKQVIEWHLSGQLKNPQVSVDMVVCSRPAKAVDPTRAAEFARRVNLDRPSKELVLVDFVNVETAPPADAARRTCPRIDEGGTILYVDTPPRRLIIEE